MAHKKRLTPDEIEALEGTPLVRAYRERFGESPPWLQAKKLHRGQVPNGDIEELAREALRNGKPIDTFELPELTGDFLEDLLRDETIY